MEQYARDFCAFRRTLSVWVLIAASLTFTRRTDGYSLLGICMGACLRLKYPPPHHLSAGRAFVWMDRYLDRAEWGPRFLQNESIATLVVTSLWRGAGVGHYQLGAFAIIANHVH